MNQKTVLVAEDDLDSSQMLEEMLALEGYTIVRSEVAQETVALLQAQRFDAVLLDLSLPGMSTDDFVEALIRDGGRSPIIVFSARPALEVQAIAARMSAAAVLAKPSDMDHMMKTIASVAEKAS